MSKMLSEDDSTALLIEIIQGYDFLYDLSHKDYKNSIKKEQAWAEIGEILHVSVEDCKKTWKNLRDHFTREKRGKPSGSGAEESNWVYFNKMLFYNKFTKARKTHTTTPPTQPSAPAGRVTSGAEDQPSSSCSSVSVWSTMGTLLSSTGRSPNSDTEEQDDSDLSSAPEVTLFAAGDFGRTQSGAGHETPRAKKKKADDDLLEVVSVAKRIATKMEQRKKPDKMDANRAFAEYVYSRLSEMTPEDAKKQRKAMLLVLEEDDE